LDSYPNHFSSFFTIIISHRIKKVKREKKNISPHWEFDSHNDPNALTPKPQ
jgi:hypothetical protein